MDQIQLGRLLEDFLIQKSKGGFDLNKEKRAKPRNIEISKDTITAVKRSRRRTKKFTTWMNEHWDEYDSWQALKRGFFEYRKQKET